MNQQVYMKINNCLKKNNLILLFEQILNTIVGNQGKRIFIMVTDVLNQIIHAVNADLASFQPQFISNIGLIQNKTF